MRFRKRVTETRRDRRLLAEDAGLGRISLVSVLAGVATAVSAFAILTGAAAGAAMAARFDLDLVSREWRYLDPPDAAVGAAALCLAWCFGGYVAGRLARRSGTSHGFYTFVLGAMLLAGAVAALDRASSGAALYRSFRSLGLPVDFDEWRELPTLVAVAWTVCTAFAATAGGSLGERWHAKLVGRATDARRLRAGDRLMGRDPLFVDLTPEPEPTRPEGVGAEPEQWREPEPAGRR
jgi:hypothetical protein